MLAEKLDRFLKEKERGVLRRGGESVLGAALNRLGREVVLSSHQECIVKIKLCSATKLGNHEIEGRENTDTKARLVDEIDGTVPVSRRHGNHGPTGKILGQIGRNVLGCEVVSQRHQWAVHFGVDIERRANGNSVGAQGQRADDEEVDRSVSVGHILGEELDKIFSGERRQSKPPRRTFDTRGNQSDRSRPGAGHG